MVERYSDYEYNFYCITDQPFEYKNIKIIPLPDNKLQGWWNKLYMFSDIPVAGTILFLDLDIVICNNMEPLWSYKQDEVVFYADWFSTNKRGNDINSSVIRFEANSLNRLWVNFLQNKEVTMSTLKGDQDFLRLEVLDPAFFPTAWFKSYRYELRGKEYLIKGINRQSTRLYPGKPLIGKDLIIAILHGYPKNHQITDPWLVENWQ
jgi:hypothetical protein